jgi:hypothetical protein
LSARHLQRLTAVVHLPHNPEIFGFFQNKAQTVVKQPMVVDEYFGYHGVRSMRVVMPCGRVVKEPSAISAKLFAVVLIFKAIDDCPEAVVFRLSEAMYGPEAVVQ